MEMIHAQVTISPIEHQFADANRIPKTFEVCGLHRVACEQRALDLYGNCCRVTGYAEFDPNNPPVYNSPDEDE
jgi:hypothetical protein